MAGGWPWLPEMAAAVARNRCCAAPVQAAAANQPDDGVARSGSSSEWPPARAGFKLGTTSLQLPAIFGAACRYPSRSIAHSRLAAIAAAPIAALAFVVG